MPENLTETLTPFEKESSIRLSDFGRKPSLEIKRGLCFNRGEDRSVGNKTRSESVSKIDIVVGSGDVNERIQN